MQNQKLCKFLAWDSDFFNVRIARVNDKNLTDEKCREIRQWCEAEKIDCLYFLADSTDKETIKAAKKNHFNFVDVRLTLELTKNKLPMKTDFPAQIRAAQTDDIASLREMAAANHRDSRFYYDGHFPESKCDELYALWLEKSCRDFADAVLVADIEGQAAAYITCSIDARRIGEIGLVGVKNSVQGKGLGGKIVQASLNWFTGQNAESVVVVTQGRNVRAQRLYQNNGFVTKSVEFWYHCWLT